LLETGILAMRGPESLVQPDTPAGLVTATAACRNGKCERVSLDRVPRFVAALDVVAEVPGLGTVRAGIAFGGGFYALIDPGQIGADPSDPYPQGYILSDSWGDAFDLLN
jgi:proline racemase